MKYNLLGNTGLKVSELCLGTMTFGGKGMWAAMGALSQKDANEIVKLSIDAGINFIDTANIYSEGLSEEITGKAIKQLGLKREELVIATKVRGATGKGPNDLGLSQKHIFQQVEESLKRLHIDYIDLYQIHGFDPLTPWEETLTALDSLVRQGKVRYIGCSNLAAWQIMKSIYASAINHLTKFISLQAYYTIASRDIEREIVPLLNDLNLGLMVWSPLAGGLLSGKYTRESTGKNGRRFNFDFPPVNKEKTFNIIDLMAEIAQNKSASVAQIALAWLLHKKHVSSVIIGVKNTNQLNDNLSSVNVNLTDDEMSQLDTISALTPEYPGWMIERQLADRVK